MGTLEQSLADVARQERERQKGVQSSTLITNDDLRGRIRPEGSPEEAPAEEAAPASTGTQPPSSTRSGVTDRQGRDEQYWREAFRKAREDLKRAQDQVRALELRSSELNTQLLRQSDMYNREYRLHPEISATQLEIEKTREEVQAARRAIATLEIALRRLGGLPGSAR